MDTANEQFPTRPSTIPMTGSWYGRVGMAPYDVHGGLAYEQALSLATAWATADLTPDESVEVEVDLIPEGDEWLVDVVAYEIDAAVTQLGTRRARIDSHGRLVA